MRNINRVLTLAIDECEVANHFDSNILLSLNFKITLYTVYFWLKIKGASPIHQGKEKVTATDEKLFYD